MFLIDIAVPRDIEPQVAQIPNVHLYNIDDLRDIAAQNLSRRTEAIEQAQAIVARQTAGFADWFRSQTTYHLLQQSGQSVTNLRTVGGGRV